MQEEWTKYFGIMSGKERQINKMLKNVFFFFQVPMEENFPTEGKVLWNKSFHNSKNTYIMLNIF